MSGRVAASNAALTFVAASCLLMASPASGQADAPPPGYERVRSEGLVLDRASADEALGRALVRVFQRARAHTEDRLGATLGGELPRVVLAPTEREFARQHEELTGKPPLSWVLAIALPGRQTVLIRGDRISTGQDFLEPTLRHEIAHLVLAGVARRGQVLIPRWLEEGLAELAAEAALSREHELELAAGARFGTLEALSSLETTFPPHAERAARAYHIGLSFVTWLDARARPRGARTIVEALERGEPAPSAIERACGLSLREAETEWRRSLAEDHSIAEALLRSGEFLWGLVSLLALAAIARYVIVAGRLRRKLAEADEVTSEAEGPETRADP